MISRFFLFLIVPVFLYSCNNNKVVIKGKLENPNGSYLYLRELTLSGIGYSDSILLDKSGSFKFKLEITEPMFYTLQVSQNTELITLLAKPGDRIKITGNADHLLKSYQITGSEESKNVQALTLRLHKTITCLDSLNNVYQQFQNNKNIENIYKILTMNYDRCLEEQRQYSISFIRKNPGSLACLMALYQQINSKTYIFDKEGDLNYFISVDSALFRNYRNTPHVKALHTNVDQMKEQKRVLQLRQMLSIMGAKAPEIGLPGLNGDTLRLSSFKGKVILVDFWVSGDEACRKENLDLAELYNKYKTKGFEIYQVSMDKSKEEWLKAIRENGVKGTQVCDFKGLQSPVAQLYNIEKIPTTFLIDKTGVIISRDLKGEELKNKLATIFE